MNKRYKEEELKTKIVRIFYVLNIHSCIRNKEVEGVLYIVHINGITINNIKEASKHRHTSILLYKDKYVLRQPKIEE